MQEPYAEAISDHTQDLVESHAGSSWKPTQAQKITNPTLINYHESGQLLIEARGHESQCKSRLLWSQTQVCLQTVVNIIHQAPAGGPLRVPSCLSEARRSLPVDVGIVRMPTRITEAGVDPLMAPLHCDLREIFPCLVSGISQGLLQTCFVPSDDLVGPFPPIVLASTSNSSLGAFWILLDPRVVLHIASVRLVGRDFALLLKITDRTCFSPMQDSS